MLEHRAVQPERRRGARLFFLVGGRVDQYLDRIADEVKPAEDQRRGDEQDEQGLRQAPQDEDGHVLPRSPAYLPCLTSKA